MTRAVSTFFAVIGLFGVAPVRHAAGAGQPPSTGGPLSVRQAAEMALMRHPSIGASEAGRDEAGAAVGEALAAWYPSLRLTGTATRYEEPYAVYPLHGFKPDQIPPFDETIYQGVLSLGYTVFDGGGRPARVRQARSQLSAATESLEATRQTILIRVLSNYLEVLSRARTLEAQDRRIAALEAEQGRVGRLMEVGRAAPIESLRVGASLAGAQAERVRLTVALDLAERDLARLIDVGPEATRAERLTGIDAPDSSFEPREVLLEQALRANPGTREARSQLAAARAAGIGSRSLRWPEVRLAGSYVGWADSEGNDAAEWSAAAQISVPLFTGGAITYGIRKADATVRRVTEQLRLAELQTEQDLDRALNVVNEAKARVASLSAAVANMAEVVRIEKLSLENGLGTQTDYLESEAELFRARAALIEARHREIVARAELARVTGALDLPWFTQYLEEER